MSALETKASHRRPSAASANSMVLCARVMSSRHLSPDGSKTLPPPVSYGAITCQIAGRKTSRSCPYFARRARSDFSRRTPVRTIHLHSISRDHRSRFAYDEWLRYFAVSLAWRCVVTSNGDGLRDHPQHAEAIDRARDIWREYLLGRADIPGPYRFNLFFTPLGGRSDSRVPDGLSWYFLRGADMTTAYSKVMAATYTKIPGMLFWTSVVPPDPGGWRGTRIAAHGTIRQSNQHLGEGQRASFDGPRQVGLRTNREPISATARAHRRRCPPRS